MPTLIFVLVWVLLALGLLLVAFSGGPGGAVQRLMSTSRVARRAAIVLFVIALIGLGIGVPAAVIAAVSNNDSIPESNVSDLTASEKHGRELFGMRCANCHTLKAANAAGATPRKSLAAAAAAAAAARRSARATTPAASSSGVTSGRRSRT